MHEYQNGDRCPCCGQVIEGKNEDWLAVFSQLCNAAGLAHREEEVPELQPIAPGTFPPPDAGIYPPVKPIFDM